MTGDPIAAADPHGSADPHRTADPHGTARQPLGSDPGSDVVELAVVERSGFDESRHFGAAVVVDRHGATLRSFGDVGADVFGRSSLKPFQAIAVLRAGVGLDGEQLVLGSASHAGTPDHVRVVRDILAAGSLDESLLACPVSWPLDEDAAFDARASGAGKQRVAMNCSGKHAAFLLASARNGWDLDGYLDPAHPMQATVRSTIEEFTGGQVGTVGTDGCGAPVFATSLLELAVGISRITDGGDRHGAALTAAVLADPWAIDGHGRANTVVIERLGVLAKGGAEGVLVVGTTEGTAVAVKVIDGSARATTAVALRLLASVGAVDPAAAADVAEQLTQRVTGGQAVVGRIRTTF